MMPTAPWALTTGRALAGPLAPRTAFTSLLRSLVLFAFLAGAALPAAAQSTTEGTTTEGTTTEGTAEEQPAAEESSDDEPAVQVEGAEQDPNSRLGEKFQDWQMVCEKRGPEGQEVCGAVQEVMTKDGKLALWTAFGYLQPADGPVMIFRIPFELTDPPTGFRVAKGAQLSVDGGSQVNIPIEICAPGGCQIGLLLEDNFVKALKGGNKLNIIMPLATGQTATINVSLQGFTAAFNSLKEPS